VESAPTVPLEIQIQTDRAVTRNRD